MCCPFTGQFANVWIQSSFEREKIGFFLSEKHSCPSASNRTDEWNLTFKRLSELRDQVVQVANEQRIDQLTVAEWGHLEAYCQLMGGVSDVTHTHN